MARRKRNRSPIGSSRAGSSQPEKPNPRQSSNHSINGRVGRSAEAASLAELLTHYQVRESIIRSISIVRSVLLTAVLIIIVGIIVIPWHLTPSSAQMAGIIGLIISFIVFFVSSSAARKVLKRTRLMTDLLDQVLQCDAYLQAHEEQDNSVISYAERHFTEKIKKVGGPKLRQVATEDGLLPVKFPLTSRAAAAARVGIDEGRRVRQGMYPLVAVGMVSFLLVSWTLAFTLTWAENPTSCALGAATCNGAFQGLSTNPTLGDFFYLTLNALVANMPPDIVARSQLAHAVFAGTFISGVMLVALYLVPAMTNLRERMAPTRSPTAE